MCYSLFCLSLKFKIAKVAKVSPNCVNIAANKEISSSVLSLAIHVAKEEIRLTNSQGFTFNYFHLIFLLFDFLLIF